MRDSAEELVSCQGPAAPNHGEESHVAESHESQRGSLTRGGFRRESISSPRVRARSSVRSNAESVFSNYDNFGEQHGSFEKRYTMFPDPAKMKETLRKQMCKEEYRVEKYYHSDGYWQRLAQSGRFEKFTMVIIFLNALWIGFDAEVNPADVLIEAPPQFFAMESLFCAFFTFEITVRFWAFRRRRDSLKDPWFRFDALLVAFMVLETWVLSLVLLLVGGALSLGVGSSVLQIFKLFRLTRLARVARLARAFPEVLVLIKGMMVALRSVFFTLLLLLVLMYIFGIMFKELAEGTRSGPIYFPNLGASMLTLLVQGTLLDGLKQITDSLVADFHHRRAIFLLALFYLYIFLSALTVLNMLIGVICEAVSTVAALEREENMIHMVKERLQYIVRPESDAFPHANDGMISKEEFRAMLENADAAQCLQEVGVDVVGLVDIADFLFEDHAGSLDSSRVDRHETHSISLAEFFEVILRLRGSNWATVKDLVETRRFMRVAVDSMERLVREATGIVSPNSGSAGANARRYTVGARPFRAEPSHAAATTNSTGPSLRSSVKPTEVSVEMAVMSPAPRSRSSPSGSSRIAEVLAARAAEVERAVLSAQSAFRDLLRETELEARRTRPTLAKEEKNGNTKAAGDWPAA